MKLHVSLGDSIQKHNKRLGLIKNNNKMVDFLFFFEKYLP